MRRILSLYLALAGAGFLVNLPWELLQMRWYQPGLGAHIALCVAAAVADAVAIVILCGLIGLRARRWDWIRAPRTGDVALLLAGGLLTALSVETFALQTGWWSYAATMPMVLGVGALPLLQMLVLPGLAVIFAPRVIRAYTS